MRRHFIKVTALLLAAVLMVSFTACGSQKDNASSTHIPVAAESIPQSAVSVMPPAGTEEGAAKTNDKESIELPDVAGSRWVKYPYLEYELIVAPSPMQLQRTYWDASAPLFKEAELEYVCVLDTKPNGYRSWGLLDADGKWEIEPWDKEHEYDISYWLIGVGEHGMTYFVFFQNAATKELTPGWFTSDGGRGVYDAFDAMVEASFYKDTLPVLDYYIIVPVDSEHKDG